MLLPAELSLAPVERIRQLLPLGDVEDEAVMEHRPTGLVANHAGLVEEPVDAPVACNHAVFHREEVARLARPPVLGEDALEVVGMDNLEVELRIRRPLVGRVTKYGPEVRTHEDVGADVIEPVDVDSDRNLLDQ